MRGIHHRVHQTVLTATISILAMSAFPAYGSIVMVDSQANFMGETPMGSGSDSAFSMPENYSVSVGANVLVVNAGAFVQTTANATGITLTWTQNGTVQNLTAAKQQVSAANTNVVADIFYLNNPISGAGVLTIAGNLRTWGFGAYTLSGVDTTVAPIVAGTDGTNGTAATTLGTSVPANSFADVSEAFRVGGTSVAYTLASTSGTTSQLYSTIDPGGFLEFGSGTVSGISGTPTITATNAGGVGATRSEIAVASFSALVPEPASLSLLGLGAFGLLARRQRYV